MAQERSILELLPLLIDYWFNQHGENTAQQNRQYLFMMGCSKNEVERIMQWLNKLSMQLTSTTFKMPSDNSIRILTDAEADKLNEQAQQAIANLMLLKIVDTRLREILINQAMALDTHEVGEYDMMSIALVMLQQDPKMAANITWLQQQLYGRNGCPH